MLVMTNVDTNLLLTSSGIVPKLSEPGPAGSWGTSACSALEAPKLGCCRAGLSGACSRIERLGVQRRESGFETTGVAASFAATTQLMLGALPADGSFELEIV